MNSQTPTSPQVQYTLYGDIQLSSAHHCLPVDPELLERVEEISGPIAQLILQAELLDDNWVVTATIGPEEEVGSIRCDPGTKREEVLNIAETWVRNSDHIKVVAGSMQEGKIPEEDRSSAILGTILVQGDQL